MENWLPRHRIDIDEYYHMAGRGLLARDARVELIDGEIIDMSPIGSPHAATVNTLAHLFNLAVGAHALVSIQAPVRLDRFSEPQPDLALLAVRADKYWRSHPTAANVFLIVEVSDSTLRYDRETKVALYARHGIPEVWIVDLENRELHIFRSPAEGCYLDVESIPDPGVMTPALLPEVSVNLSGLLRV
jgi:Uma2 family endonuclease